MHGQNPSRRLPHEQPPKKPREQYLGSLKEPLNKTKEDHGSSTTLLCNDNLYSSGAVYFATSTF